MKLSVKKLKKWKAYSPGIDLYIKAGCPNTVEKTVEMYIESENELYLSHANWLLNKAFSKKQNIQ